jgi:hypothetical protein
MVPKSKLKAHNLEKIDNQSKQEHAFEDRINTHEDLIEYKDLESKLTDYKNPNQIEDQ